MSENDKDNDGLESVEDGEAVEGIDYETALQDQLEYLPFDDDFEIEPSNLKLLKVTFLYTYILDEKILFSHFHRSIQTLR